jgi:hypothetical protein
MGYRSPAKLIVFLAALIAACSPGAAEEGSMRAGEPVPREWLPLAQAEAGAGSAETSLVWVFRTRDCMTCQSFDYTIRRLQAIYRDSVPFAAVHVGTKAEASVPEAFFTSRRIKVSRSSRHSPREFDRRFPGAALPSLLVVREGRIVWSSVLPQGVSTSEQVDSIVRAARAAAASAEGDSAGRIDRL